MTKTTPQSLAFGLLLAGSLLAPVMSVAEICEPTLKAEQQALPALSRAARERIAANRAALKETKAQFSGYPPEIQIALARKRIPNLHLSASFSTLHPEQRAAANEAAGSAKAFRSALEQMANAKTIGELALATDAALIEIEKNKGAYAEVASFIPSSVMGVNEQTRINRNEIAEHRNRSARLAELVKAYSRALETQLEKV